MRPRTPGAELPGHPDWLWRTPEPKRSYDFVIVGCLADWLLDAATEYV
ncbi:hypothetical protein ACFYO0_35315 [Streptomyces sp. NPDC006365]